MNCQLCDKLKIYKHILKDWKVSKSIDKHENNVKYKKNTKYIDVYVINTFLQMFHINCMKYRPTKGWTQKQAPNADQSERPDKLGQAVWPTT